MGDGLNEVNLIGNLGVKPEMRGSKENPVLSLSLATNESWIDDDGEKQTRTEWHRISVFGKRATGLAKVLTAGKQIYVKGRLQTSSYEKDGEKRYSTDIIARDVILCGTPNGQRQEEESEPEEKPAPKKGGFAAKGRK